MVGRVTRSEEFQPLADTEPVDEEPEGIRPQVTRFGGSNTFGQVPPMANRAAVGPKFRDSAMVPVAS